MQHTTPRGPGQGETMEEFTVCIVPGGCCLEVSHGESQEELLVSFTSGAIQVYNVHDLKLVCSWQLTSSQKLVCGALFHQETGQYWAVGSQGSVEWSRSDSAITTTHHVLSQPVKLLSCCGWPQPFVVSRAGKVGCVKSEMDVCWLAPRRKKWQLCFAEVSCDQRVCVVGRDRQVTVGVAGMGERGLGPPVVTCLPFKGDALVSCCLCGDKLLFQIGVGELWVLPVAAPHHPVQCASALPAATPSTHLLAFSHTHFVHVDRESLQLWEAHYCTCQHQVDVAISSDVKFWCAEGHVYAWSGEGKMTGWRVQSSRPTLASALGKVGGGGRVQPAILSSWPASSKDLKVWKGEEKCVSASALDYLEALVDKTKTPDLEKFLSVFNSQPLTPKFCYSAVLERVLCEEEFWASSALSALVTSGLVPSNQAVLSGVVSRGDWSLAHACLVYGPPPDEECLVTVLEAVLRLPATFECVSDGRVISREQLLYWVLCQPFTDTFIQSPCAALPFSLVKELLSLLSKQVTISAFLTPGSDHSPPHSQKTTDSDPYPLSYHVTLEWLAVLLNTHFTQFALHQESRHILLALQSNISDQVKCYNHLCYLKSLEEVQANWKRHNSDKWLYKVETFPVKM